LQGKIVRNDTGYEGLNVVNGTPTCVASGADTCDFQVKYYSASTAGTLYLTEEFENVEIGDYGGVFNLKLGSGNMTTTTECSDGTCSDPQEVISEFETLYIQIEFAPTGDGATYSEIFTRTALNASPYSIRSKYSEGSVNDAFKFYNASSVSSTVEGSVYYDSDDGELKLYNGGEWVSVGNAGASAWGTSDVSGLTHNAYLASGGISGFENFTLDTDDDRLSINSDQAKGGLSVYSSYSGTGAWPVVSFKADSTTFDGPVLQLVQDGEGTITSYESDILQAYSGSTRSFRIDRLGDIHLESDGIAYFEGFDTAPSSSDLNPSTNEGCIYSYGSSIYWDPACDGTAEVQMDNDTGGGLWTDGGTFTYLADSAEDLVLGANSVSGSSFFFDVSENRLGIGTGTPQAAIDIAGTSSEISNSSGDITISPNEDLIISGANVGIGIVNPAAQLDIVGSSDEVQLSVKGNSTQTNNIVEVKKSDDSNLLTLSNAGLLTLSGNFLGGTNNSYDIGTSSTRWKDLYTQGTIQIGANGDSGSIRYNTTSNELEFSNNGSTWIALGSATKTETLSAEYAGAVLAADGTNNVGAMTSDAEGSTNDSMNYYEWNSSEFSANDYDIRVRFQIPSDFTSWSTSAIQFYYSTESTTLSTNKIDFYVYEESSSIVDASSTNNVSGTSGTWENSTISGSSLTDCSTAGDICVFVIRMTSSYDAYARIGDIKINYNRKL
jgi:hypothetical protein